MAQTQRRDKTLMTQSRKSIYEAQAFNDASGSENRIHTDSVAQQFGFEGALVAGTTVFGHMTYLPIKENGLNWFCNNRAEVRFFKPAYDGDILTIEHEETDQEGVTLCYNLAKTLLAKLDSRPGRYKFQPASEIPPTPGPLERSPISWHNLYTDKAGPAHIWHADYDANLRIAEQVNDDLDLYQRDDAVVHPLWILHQSNQAFMRSFILPAWLHVGSILTLHKPLMVGDEIETRMVPTSKWKQKGHQFTRLYIPFLVDGQICVEVEHTAIFHIAPP